MPSHAVVWFKRDLRIGDHAPLVAAAACDQATALFVIEPTWLRQPECDAAHVEFTLGCLAELRNALAPRGLPLRVVVAELPQAFEDLAANGPVTHLFSHEETGPAWTFDRDRRVAGWCRARGVVWQEFTQTGVVRRLAGRRGWAGRWQQRMDLPLCPTPAGFRAAVTPQAGEAALPTLASLGLAPHGKTLQPAGEAAGRATLDDFLYRRAAAYRRSLSSPLTAGQGCSRLSPHLAFGTVSLRQVHQATQARIDVLRAGTLADDQQQAHALRAFAGRLRWHCHFMQKLEDEPRIEFHNFARACDGLRPGDLADDLRDGLPEDRPSSAPDLAPCAAALDASSQARLAAWSAGATGYPMVDACMRQLRATGWLNFRMRAMLVSFAAYHLWLHWRATGQFLARQFLDFEAGIHWSQMQMQSGTTGINTLRMYSPTKQARDHDPDGQYIRRWVPELARLPLAQLATPWALSAAAQREAGCVIGRDYPAPLVDERAALQAARERLYALRATTAAQTEAQAIQQRHGSRLSGLPPSGSRAARPRPPAESPQLSLFGDVVLPDADADGKAPAGPLPH
jgi:deoxyribodipyrimidine photo-lyase